MKIRSIHLQNIKCYSDQRVTFHEGVNFISGQNGAGKSTIIEAIGYCLFDFNPYPNVRDFIRYGAKSGKITVDFTANDDCDYRVVRKIGTSWTVYDLESGGEIDLHGTGDVKEWLKEVMGVDRDIELDQLFRDVIGVPQGTFVAPFLDAPKMRKAKFDGILKVEQYREAYSNSVKALSYLKEHLNNLNTELKIKSSLVTGYDQLKTDLARLEKLVAEKSTELNKLKTQIREQEKEIKKQEQIKTVLEKTESEIKVAQAELDMQNKRQNELAGELDLAEAAQQKVKIAEAGYKAYIKISEKLKALDQKRSAKDIAEKELSNLKVKSSAMEQGIREKENFIVQESKNTARNIAAVERDLKQLAILINDASNQFAASKAAKARIARWLEQEEALARIYNQLDKMRLDALAKTGQIDVLKTEEKELTDKFSSYAETEKIALTLEQRKADYQHAQEQWSALNNKLQTLKQNLKQSKDGLCPFLKSPCRNVQGDLQAYFTTQIAQTEQELAELKKTGLQLAELKKEAESAFNLCNQLQGSRDRLKQIAVQRDALQKEIREILAKASGLPIVKTIDLLAETSGLTFEQAVRTYESVSGLKTETSLAAGLSALDSLLADLDTIQKNSRSQREKAVADNDRQYNDHAAKTAALDREFKLHTAKLKELQDKEKKLATDKSELEKEKARLLEIQKAVRDKETEMAQFQGLAAEIKEAQKQQDNYRQDYDSFIKNSVLAGKAKELATAISQVAVKIQEQRELINTLKSRQQELSAAFNENAFNTAKEHLESLKNQAATETQYLAERRQDLSEGLRNLTEMEKVIGEINDLQSRINAGQNNLALLEIIRSILNKAGPPVAKVYLENLSREANELYRRVSRENVALEWREGYEIVLLDNLNGRQRERSFKQFSGGEQMTAALAVRLALLKQQSRVKLGFFDEPTQNLDSGRRSNLAETIPLVTGGFDQIFVISHDDTFDELTENIIQLQKDDGEGTIVV